MSIIVDPKQLRRNTRGDQFAGHPTHGSVGWIDIDGIQTELLFWDKADRREWLTKTEFCERRRSLKATNLAFYLRNPHLLAQKIRDSRKPRRNMFRTCCGWSEFGIPH